MERSSGTNSPLALPSNSRAPHLNFRLAFSASVAEIASFSVPEPRKAPALIMPKSASVEIVYSSEPSTLVDLTALPNTRFLIPSERQLPYRDGCGRVNINLLDASLAEIESEAWASKDVDALRTRITAWQRAARKSLAARPDDEKMTLDDLVGSSVGNSSKDKVSATPTKRSDAASKRPPSLPGTPQIETRYVGCGAVVET